MEITKLLNLISNCLGLILLVSKTLYDVYYNPWKFRQELNKNIDPLLAAKRKRQRTDKTTIITFAGLAGCYIISIIENLYK